LKLSAEFVPHVAPREVSGGGIFQQTPAIGIFRFAPANQTMPGAILAFCRSAMISASAIVLNFCSRACEL